MENKIQKSFSGPLLLCILDGFGVRENVYGNAVKQANTPVLDELFLNNPHSELITHGEAVGLPKGQMGNSEVGHMTIGSGRTILQNLDLIRTEFSGGMANNKAFEKSLKQAEQSDKIHLVGMISDGGIHSHVDHLVLLCEKLNVLNKPVYIHAILDGRDTAPNAAIKQLNEFESRTKHLENISIVDVCGRFYAMDRDGNWDRLSKAYKLYTENTDVLETDLNTVIQSQYDQNNLDEFVEPTKLQTNTEIKNGDSIFFFNFRADRMRHIVETFIDDELDGFDRGEKLDVHVTCMTEYDVKFNNRVTTLFPPTLPKNTIGEIISALGGKQLRIAESEKYAHVTFFLNGGLETPFGNEERIVIPSPKVRSYDLAPKMSLEEVKNKLQTSIETGNFDLIVLNVANGDQVGHSGSLEASIEAVEFIDNCLADVVQSLEKSNGEMVLIADHGNCEEMLTESGELCTSHTLNPVPFLYVGRSGYEAVNGSLKDVAPTLLNIMNIKQPEEMTGTVLLKEKRAL